MIPKVGASKVRVGFQHPPQPRAVCDLLHFGGGVLIVHWAVLGQWRALELADTVALCEARIDNLHQLHHCRSVPVPAGARCVG